MMKKYTALLSLNVLCLSSTILHGMEKAPQDPMNYQWFYDHQNHEFANANQLYQNLQWADASSLYINTIDYTNNSTTDLYNTNMALLNLAACLMAQRKATEHWATFDALLNIEKSRRISCAMIKNVKQDASSNKTILIRTDLVGIGDIFHFLSAAGKLKKDTGWNVIVKVPPFLKPALTHAVGSYGLAFFDETNPPTIDYETHLIALLGHLELTPAQMNPKKVLFTSPERAINAVVHLIMPILKNQNNRIVVVDRGEVGRQATLIGGKQLPRNPKDHGRHLDSAPFNTLLNKHADIVLLDCSRRVDRVVVDEKQKNRCLIIPDEVQPFDTIIALGFIMSHNKHIIAFGPDMGQTNVFIRSLEDDAQNRTAIIIPNAKEHDMRTSGDGFVYKHMISNCWVYKCETPIDQTKVIEQAYQDMKKYQ